MKNYYSSQVETNRKLVKLWNSLVCLFAILFFTVILNAQSDNPPGCPLCSESLYFGTTAGFTPDTLNYDFPCGTIENSQWHSVIPNPSGSINILFYDLVCDSTNAIEGMIYDSNYQPVSTCFSTNNLGNGAINASVTPGATYFILIDGVNGAECEFSMRISGVNSPVPTSLGFITGETPICGETQCYSVASNPCVQNYIWEIPNHVTITSGGELKDTFICVRYNFVAQGRITVTPTTNCGDGFSSLFFADAPPMNPIMDTTICPGTCISINGNSYCQSVTEDISVPCGIISEININFADTSDFEINCFVDSFTNSIAFDWSELGADNFDIFINDVFQTTQSFSSYLLPFNQISGDEIKIKVIPSSILGCSFKTSETICKFNNPTNSTQQIPSERINIFPNPTSNIVEITSEIPIEKVSVFDLSGRLILESFDEKIDLSNYDSGVYFLIIETPEGIFVEKIIRL